jgi:hypothetical protein
MPRTRSSSSTSPSTGSLFSPPNSPLRWFIPPGLTADGQPGLPESSAAGGGNEFMPFLDEEEDDESDLVEVETMEDDELNDIDWHSNPASDPEDDLSDMDFDEQSDSDFEEVDPNDNSIVIDFSSEKAFLDSLAGRYCEATCPTHL